MSCPERTRGCGEFHAGPHGDTHRLFCEACIERSIAARSIERNMPSLKWSKALSKESSDLPLVAASYPHPMRGNELLNTLFQMPPEAEINTVDISGDVINLVPVQRVYTIVVETLGIRRRVIVIDRMR